MPRKLNMFHVTTSKIEINENKIRKNKIRQNKIKDDDRANMPRPVRKEQTRASVPSRRESKSLFILILEMSRSVIVIIKSNPCSVLQRSFATSCHFALFDVNRSC